MCINLLKMSCRKRWKWHFRDPKFKTFFLGSMPPDTPRLGLGVQSQNLARAYIRSKLILRYAPESLLSRKKTGDRYQILD